MWYVCLIMYLISLGDINECYSSGLWGVLSVGFFSERCLIRELYGNLCFCEESKLGGCVSAIIIYYLHVFF